MNTEVFGIIDLFLNKMCAMIRIRQQTYLVIMKLHMIEAFVKTRSVPNTYVVNDNKEQGTTQVKLPQNNGWEFSTVGCFHGY